MIKSYEAYFLNEAVDFDFWYPQFQGRFYSSAERATADIVNAVAHRNKQCGVMFSKYDPAEVAALFTVSENPTRKRDAWFIKPVEGMKMKPKPRKVYEYETSTDLRSKQVRTYMELYSLGFDRYMGGIEWFSTNDKRIYGTERTDPHRVEYIKQAIKDGVELPPILLDDDYGILDGHHRYEAVKALKIKQIPVVIYYRHDEEGNE